MGLADTAQCEYGSEEQIPERILQVCPVYQERRRELWTQDTQLHTKLLGFAVDLRRTASLDASAGLTI